MQQAQVDPQMVAQLQEQLQRLTLENEGLKLDMKNKEDKNRVDIYNAESTRIKALSDHEVDANQMEMDAIKMIIDGSKALDDQDIQREAMDIKKNTPSSAGTKRDQPSE
jgi:hypothetical protein